MKKSSRTMLSRQPNGFSLVEILTVITIIAILAGLTLAAFSGVQRSAFRSRAKNEIGALAGALENYKADTGGYPNPTAVIFSSTSVYTTALPNQAAGLYQQSSQLLYQCLTGQTNYGDPPPKLGSGVRTYFAFKSSQLGNNSAAAGAPIYIKDPFGNSYGYFNGNAANLPYNGTNQYDLWSTAGDTAGANVPGWVTDWGN
jgi:prepilin-type N-terminal cleavage/methylation domain-containing protein